MDCAQCGHANPPDSRFCFECGAPCARPCARCGSELPAGVKFCNRCGAPTDPPAAPAPRTPSDYTPDPLARRIRAEGDALGDGERKTITALFADLKGSTALIEHLDPEEARAALDPALELMMEAVHRYEGFVAQALGDGIFALFGAPIAHEDHPQRALHAALAMQASLRTFGEDARRRGEIPLQLRVGVNTGEVVVRSIRKDDLHADYTPVGHSTHVAARMEQLADPGTILVAEDTHRLSEGFFEFRALGDTPVKGVDRPIAVYELTGAGPQRTRFEVAAERGLSRFVGRQLELDQLVGAKTRADAGHGQVVAVVGDAGLGKSRLFHEFKERVGREALVLEAPSIAHGAVSAYAPVVEMLRRYFEIDADEAEKTREEKIRRRVSQLDGSLEGDLPYLFSLLGIDADLGNVSVPEQRARTHDAITHLLLRESRDRPLAVVFEDLHWIDNATQAFLDALVPRTAGARILLLLNYRPREYRHEWSESSNYTELRLAPLVALEAEDLLTSLLGPDPSVDGLRGPILERSEGTPFFMEEVVQTLAEEGVLEGVRGGYRARAGTVELRVSPTVRGVLAARIDRLTSEEKDLLQHLAVIGREFPVALVQAVVSRPTHELDDLLAALQAKAFVHEQPARAALTYQFKHALTQEVAYETVLREGRRTLHERTGHAIEALFGEALEDYYGDLAHHFRHSANTDKALRYLTLAGRQAVRRVANHEAIEHLSAAIALLPEHPKERQQATELVELLLELGMALERLHGWGAPEVEAVYTRALALSEEQGLVRQRVQALVGVWDVYVNHDKLLEAREFAAEGMKLGDAHDDDGFRLWSHTMLGITDLFLGDLVAANDHFDRASALYARAERVPRFASFDPDVGATVDGAVTRWLLGYPDQAAARIEGYKRRAAEIGDSFHVLMASVWAAWLHQLRGEPEAARRDAELGLRGVSGRGGGDQLDAMSTFFRGWAVTKTPAEGAGSPESPLQDGIREMRQGLADAAAARTLIWQPHWLALVAEAHAEAGEIDRALDTLDEAVESATHGRGYYRAELERIRGELLLARTPPDAAAAEANFERALATARSQASKAYELRAATSLARLWQHQGRAADARALLEPVYQWFTEGFDTPDLLEAQALLSALR